MEEKYKIEKESNSSDDEEPYEKSQHPSVSASSSSTEEYDQYLKIHQINPFFQSVNSFEPQLKENKITYNESVFCEQPTLIIKSHSTNYQILHLLVSFSHFTFDLEVLNLPNKLSPILEHPKEIGSGAMGAVRKIQESNGKEFVIKIIKHTAKQLNENGKSLRSSIVEYCMNKLFSVFKIGPHVGQDYLGFDVIIYDESVAFATEFCENISKIEESTHCLLSKLVSMHKLRVIHGDIKPQNLMYSKKYDGPVFIDFGLSKSIVEEKGFCTFTQFFGTFHYSSPKMKELFFDKKFGELDLYYNDFYCLREAMKEVESDIQNMKICIFEEKEIKRLKPEEVFKMNEVQKYLNNIRLQKIILTRNYKEVKTYLMENEKFEVEENTIEILEELNFTAGIKQIGKLIKDHFLLDEGLSEKLYEICHHDKFYHENSNPKKFQKLSKRLKESFSSQNMALTEMMLTLYIFFNQDVTSRAQLEKKIMKENILCLKPNENKFWMSVVDFSSNFFTSKIEIIEIFDYIGNKLEIEWSDEENNFHEVYSKSWKLCEVAYKKYNISISSLLKEREGVSQNKNNLFGAYVNLENILSKYEENKAYKSYKFTQTKVFQEFMEILLQYSQNEILAEQVLSKMNCIKMEIDMNNNTDGFELIVNQFIFDVSFVLNGPNTSFCFEEIEDSYRNYGYPEKIKPIIFSRFKKIYYNMFYVAKQYTNVAQECTRLQDLSFNYCFEIGPTLELFILSKIILKLSDLNFNTDELQKKFNEIRQNFEILELSNHIYVLMKWCYRIIELLKKSLKRSTDRYYRNTWAETSVILNIYEMMSKTEKFVVDLVELAERFGKLDDRALLILVSIIHNHLMEFEEKQKKNKEFVNLAVHITEAYPYLKELAEYSSSYEYKILSIKHQFMETQEFYEAVRELHVNKFPKITNYCECEFYHLLICLKIKRNEDSSNELRQLIIASMVPEEKFQSLIKVSHSLIDFLSLSISKQTDYIDEFFGYFLEIVRQSSKVKSNSHFLELYLSCIQMGKVIFLTFPEKNQIELLRKPLLFIIKAFRVEQQMNNESFISNFSNCLPLLEIIIELISKKQVDQDVSQEFRTELKTFLKFISILGKNSFSLAKWRMRNKFYFILEELIRKDFIALESPPKMLLYFIRQYRNSQYEIPNEDAHIEEILKKKKTFNLRSGTIEDMKSNRSFVKVLMLAERGITEKLKLWNQNKSKERKIDVLENFAIIFDNKPLYSEMLNEVYPNSDELFLHLRRVQKLIKVDTEELTEEEY